MRNFNTLTIWEVGDLVMNPTVSEFAFIEVNKEIINSQLIEKFLDN